VISLSYETEKHTERKNAYPFSSDVKTSVKAYVEARLRSGLSREVLDSEAKRLFSYFREYAQSKKGEQVQSFTGVLAEFYSEVGLDGIDSKGIRSSLTRRFKKMIRRYNAGNSENQRKLDEFYF